MSNRRDGSLVVGLVSWVQDLMKLHLGRLKPLELRCLIVLIGHANNATSECWPSLATIARYAGCASESRVCKALRSLEAMGLVQIVRRGGGNGSTVRRLTLSRSPTSGE